MDRQEIVDELAVNSLILENVSNCLEKLFHEINLPNRYGDKSLLSLSLDCDILAGRVESLKKEYIESVK